MVRLACHHEIRFSSGSRFDLLELLFCACLAETPLLHFGGNEVCDAEQNRPKFPSGKWRYGSVSADKHGGPVQFSFTIPV